MRSIIFSLSILFFSATLYAQSSAESKAILDKASQLFEQSEGVKLSFVLAPDSPDGGNFEPQEGVAFIKRNKFKLDMPYSTTWFDGTTQWVLLKDANEVNISSPAAEDLVSISPLGLLNMYKTNYTLKSPTTRTFNGNATTEIEMTPINKRQDFERLTIAIDKKTNSVVMVRFTTRDGNKNKLTISNYNSNNKYTNDLFKFNKNNHPGVEIIDLR
ncbi:MAG: outer membrane lipoprotein carrier protein LolA, partial [Bacteroidales bacterium]|nr:outer membrane lipoprotein carrier protein LolA [Bacteroidales bacterium]